MEEKKNIQEISDQELAKVVGGGLVTDPSFSCTKLDKTQCEAHAAQCTWTIEAGQGKCVDNADNQQSGSGRDDAYVA